MSSILIISEYDEGVPLAFALRSEGHIVRTLSKHCPEIFNEGANPARITRPTQMLEQFDLLLSTTTQIDPELEKSKRLIGAGRFHTKLLDPVYMDSIRMSLLLETSPTPLNGQKMLVTAWMSSNGFCPFHLITLTYDRLMEGERGPLFYAGSTHKLIAQSKLFDFVFLPLLPLLLKVNFIGPLTACLHLTSSMCYVNWLSPLPLPFILQGLKELYRPSLFSLLWELLSNGGKEREEVKSNECSLCVSLSCSPPRADECFLNPPPEALPHLWLRDAKETPEGFLTMGTSGLLGCISARGVTIKECKRRVQRTLSNAIKSPEVQYRSDIGDNAEQRFSEIRGWGWMI